MFFQLTKYQNASVLDTLAVAYAASGQFEKAVRTAQTAIDLSSRVPVEMKAQAEKLTEEISKRLELYKQSKVYREPAQR